MGGKGTVMKKVLANCIRCAKTVLNPSSQFECFLQPGGSLGPKAKALTFRSWPVNFRMT